MSATEKTSSILDALEAAQAHLQEAKTLEEARHQIGAMVEVARTTKQVEKDENAGKIEYENVTIKVPKAVMDLLRFSESVIEQTPIEFIEYHVVETVRAGVDSEEFLPTGKALAEKFNLNPVFQAIINDPVK